MKVKRTVEQEIYVPDLGLKIQEARKAVNKPLTVLCKEANVSRNYWYQLESGKIPGTVSEQTLRRIEQVLGVSLGANFEELLVS
jgi:transcriptional regulator with XRE-family HTH domain